MCNFIPAFFHSSPSFFHAPLLSCWETWPCCWCITCSCTSWWIKAQHRYSNTHRPRVNFCHSLHWFIAHVSKYLDASYITRGQLKVPGCLAVYTLTECLYGFKDIFYWSGDIYILCIALLHPLALIQDFIHTKLNWDGQNSLCDCLHCWRS